MGVIIGGPVQDIPVDMCKFDSPNVSSSDMSMKRNTCQHVIFQFPGVAGYVWKSIIFTLVEHNSIPLGLTHDASRTFLKNVGSHQEVARESQSRGRFWAIKLFLSPLKRTNARRFFNQNSELHGRPMTMYPCDVRKQPSVKRQAESVNTDRVLHSVDMQQSSGWNQVVNARANAGRIRLNMSRGVL